MNQIAEMLMKFLFSFTAALMMFAISNNDPSLAHGVVSHEAVPGKIVFSYDDGTPLANGHITVFDHEGKEIAAAQTDLEGMFDYSEYENAGRVAITDVFGHHLDHIPGAEYQESGNDHSHELADEQKRDRSKRNPFTILAVASVLVAFSIAMRIWNLRKK